MNKDIKFILSRINQHPLNPSKYTLMCPLISLPPYINSLEKCQEKQINFEELLQRNFKKTPEDKIKTVIESAVKFYNYNEDELWELYNDK